jgi:hypothetical protein
MKPYNEKEFNRMCAEFMGLTPLTYPYYGAYTLNTPSLIPNEFLRLCHREMEGESWYLYPKFHSDWNWIIEVWNKLRNSKADEGFQEHKEFQNRGEILQLIEMGLICGDIDEVVQCLWVYFNSEL